MNIHSNAHKCHVYKIMNFYFLNSILFRSIRNEMILNSFVKECLNLFGLYINKNLKVELSSFIDITSK